MCILTDYKSDLIDYLEDEKEVYSYKNIEELNEKIVFLYNNPEKAKIIGKDAQKRIIHSHNTLIQIDIVSEYIRNVS